MKSDELLSKTINYLRFPLTLGIVFIHFNLAKHNFVLNGVSYGAEYPNWFYYIINFFSEVLPRIGVPLFFFISGFLFFYKRDFDFNVYKRNLKSRARSLMLPYVLWNVIAVFLAAIVFLPFLASMYTGSDEARLDLSLKGIIGTFFNTDLGCIVYRPRIGDRTNFDPYPLDVPLWYVRELLTMALLSPLLFWCIKKGKQWFIMLTGLMWYFTTAYFYPQGGYFALLAPAVFFFSWGGYYSINKLDFVAIFRKFKYIPIIIYIPIAIADAIITEGNFHNKYLHDAGIIFGVLSAVIIASWLLESGKVKVNTTLANCSFFVFALHKLIIDPFSKILFKFLHIPDHAIAMLIFYFVIPILITLLCLGVYLFLKKYVSPVCNALTGGR